MRTIYVVFAEDGEYSDYRMWIVRAFEKEDAAREFVAMMTPLIGRAEAESTRLTESGVYYWKLSTELLAEITQHDQLFRYTDEDDNAGEYRVSAKYSYKPVELL